MYWSRRGPRVPDLWDIEVLDLEQYYKLVVSETCENWAIVKIFILEFVGKLYSHFWKPSEM